MRSNIVVPKMSIIRTRHDVMYRVGIILYTEVPIFITQKKKKQKDNK